MRLDCSTCGQPATTVLIRSEEVWEAGDAVSEFLIAHPMCDKHPLNPVGDDSALAVLTPPPFGPSSQTRGDQR